MLALIPGKQTHHYLRLRVDIALPDEFFIVCIYFHYFAGLCCCIQCFASIHFIAKYPGMPGFYPAADLFIEENALHVAKVGNGE